MRIALIMLFIVAAVADSDKNSILPSSSMLKKHPVLVKESSMSWTLVIMNADYLCERNIVVFFCGEET